MTSLHSLQQRFAEVLSGADPGAIDDLVVKRGIPAAERAAIYRNNVRATFRGVMSLGFPATERLVGADYFRALVDQYQRAHPSRCGNLQHAGADFHRFVTARFKGSSYAYLADVVAIEWAYQEVLVASDHACLDLDRLGPVAPADYAGLHLILHPAARLVASPFPLGRIWRANRPETLDTATIDLGAGADRILLLRRGLEVEIHHLAPEEFAFLAALRDGETLGNAFDAALLAAPGLEPAPLLARYAGLAVIVDFRIDSAEPRGDGPAKTRLNLGVSR